MSHSHRSLKLLAFFAKLGSVQVIDLKSLEVINDANDTRSFFRAEPDPDMRSTNLSIRSASFYVIESLRNALRLLSVFSALGLATERARLSPLSHIGIEQLLSLPLRLMKLISL